jgi:hypothetical protein
MSEVGPGVYPHDDNLSAYQAPRTRPRQATVAAVLLIVFGALAILLTFFLYSLLSDAEDHGEEVPAISWGLVYLQFALSGTQIVSGIFVLRGAWWARLLGIVLCGINLVGAVVNLVSGAVLPAIIAIILNVALIKYLMNEDVREWCD